MHGTSLSSPLPVSTDKSDCCARGSVVQAEASTVSTDLPYNDWTDEKGFDRVGHDILPQSLRNSMKLSYVQKALETILGCKMENLCSQMLHG